MTSVLGHLLSYEFEPRYKSWTSCDPSVLFDAPIEVFVSSDSEPIADNIKRHARRADVLFNWTDCDREGEHIDTEIRSVAAQSNQALVRASGTVRAYFFNIERTHIIHAVHCPVNLDEAQANAVASRIELDLRVGASFTRHLTLSLRPILQRGNLSEACQLISYGSCQFPTLGFIAERYWRVRNFIPEPFWSIKLMHQKAGARVNFSWARKHLFDRSIADILYERCLDSQNAQVQKVKTTPTSKWKPLPLTTLELQKCGSRFFGMNSQKVLQLAEKLYQKGWISYPRTETDQFDRGMDLRGLVQKQAQGGRWADYATALVEGGGFSWPRNGHNNDKAHPPIHPVNFVNPATLSHEEQRVHEFIIRRFLACCSKDAQGSKTDISILYGPEKFQASGLVILEHNYLDVYVYDRWSNQELPTFIQGEVFEPTEAMLSEGKISPPGYLTEPDLLALMNANGIGTDATMADHIVTIIDRQYVEARAQPRQVQHGNDEEKSEELSAQARGGNGHRGRIAVAPRRGGRNSGAGCGGAITGVREFIPMTLGIALVEGHENMGFETNLMKPFLRREMELKMTAICNGQTTKTRVVNETIEQYRGVYTMQQRQGVLRTVRTESQCTYYSADVIVGRSEVCFR
ncbi:hypothetical protein H106_00614 [Trichophyton rubrum CBS 735.88]|nr:hypothetical protein H106_00614 [Trichophyton rubrum CBS 735.88]